MRVKRCFALGLFLFVSIFQLALADAPKKGDISASEAIAMLKEKGNELRVLDVRTPGEFAQGHIENARNLDYFGAAFEREAATLDKNAPILLYCRSGTRSASARDLLEKEGFKNVYNLKGGINAWEKSGGKVVRGATQNMD